MYKKKQSPKQRKKGESTPWNTHCHGTRKREWDHVHSYWCQLVLLIIYTQLCYLLLLN